MVDLKGPDPTYPTWLCMVSRFTAQNLCESQWNIADLLDFCSFDRSHSPEMPMVYWWSENLRELVYTDENEPWASGGPQQANYEFLNGQNFEARERIRIWPWDQQSTGTELYQYLSMLNGLLDCGIHILIDTRNEQTEGHYPSQWPPS